MGRRSSRYEEGLFVVEGELLLAQAFDAGWNVIEQFQSIDARDQFRDGPPVSFLDGNDFKKISDVMSPQGVAAIVSMEPPSRLTNSIMSWCVVCDSIADPGNLGTIMRSAEAAGASTISLVGTCVDPFSPKVVRASAGAIFHVQMRLADTFEQLLAQKVRLVGLTSHDTVSGKSPKSLYDLTTSGRLGLVVGSESHGISKNAPIDEWITIAHVGRSESLNAAMAATVACMYVAHNREAMR
ncbi:MAG: RNA methyltransferase [Ilumatobacteraceae bacterium]|nr:RNA methyltransferase [Ilumatobacteraceae bacterium]